MSAQIRHILDDANMDDEDIMRIMSIVEKQEEKLQEKSMKLYDLSRENGELREACMKFVEIPDEIQKHIDEVEERKEYVEYLQHSHKELKAEVEELKNFDNWENHPALKHKVVLDDDFYREHTDTDGELIDPDEFEKLKERTAAAVICMDSLHKSVTRLKKENEKLKEKLNSIQGEIKDVLKEEEKLCEKDDY